MSSLPGRTLERESTLTEVESPWAIHTGGDQPRVPALVVAWSAEEPDRVGEVAYLPIEGAPRLLGRGPELMGDEAPRLSISAHRPGHSHFGGEVLGPQISRRQALLKLSGSTIDVRNVGSCPMRVNGITVHQGVIAPGDTLTFKDQLVLLCVDRPARMPVLRTFDIERGGAFGMEDELGMVGESPIMWKLRDDIAFLARAAGHVLVLGDSGVGKEVTARAIHGLSDRGARPIVARSAATFPDTLIDAELFGNVGNYPNPGMRDRPGLIGEADRSTLFLDEIGELPQALQARLLRVLDSDGEYSRLGEAKSRRADIRLIAATNRGTSELKPDFAARFTLRVRVPGLNERREDIPLLIRHLLRRAAAVNSDVARRFYPADDTRLSRPRIAPQLVDQLVRRVYKLHVRELDGLLWRAMLSSPGDFIGLTAEVMRELEPNEISDSGYGPADVTEEAVRSSLDRHEGNVTRAARDLGLKNRYVLYRLMSKYGIR